MWDCAKDSAFKNMLIASAGTLAYFDTNKRVTMEVKFQKNDLMVSARIRADRKENVCNCV